MLLSLSTFPFSSQSQHIEISPDRIIQNMLSSIEDIHTLSYDLRNSERFDGNLISGEYLVKYSSHPKKYHFYMIYPEKGSELVYVTGANKNVEGIKIGDYIKIKGVIRSGAEIDKDLELYEDVIIEKSDIVL